MASESRSVEIDDFDDGASGADDEMDDFNSGRPYVPPAIDQESSKHTFGSNLDPTFVVPSRLLDKPYELVETANDWHFGKLNPPCESTLRVAHHPSGPILENVHELHFT